MDSKNGKGNFKLKVIQILTVMVNYRYHHNYHKPAIIWDYVHLSVQPGLTITLLLFSSEGNAQRLYDTLKGRASDVTHSRQDKPCVIFPGLSYTINHNRRQERAAWKMISW